jgi:hypothetical protein
MNYAILVLQEKQVELVAQLREGSANKADILQQKKEIDTALNWLETIDKQNLGHVSDYEWVELPFMKNGYSSYRIMDDGETDNREHWIEFKTPIEVTATDFLVLKKPK